MMLRRLVTLVFITATALVGPSLGLIAGCTPPSPPPPPAGPVACAAPEHEGLLCSSKPPNLFGVCKSLTCMCCTPEKTDAGVADVCNPCP